MADLANSTPASAVPPPCPLPAGASLDWLHLWDSSRWLHPRIADAERQAFDAGCEPRHLIALQLCTPADEPEPQLWFGPRWGDVTAKIGPDGEVGR